MCIWIILLYYYLRNRFHIYFRRSDQWTNVDSQPPTEQILLKTCNIEQLIIPQNADWPYGFVNKLIFEQFHIYQLPFHQFTSSTIGKLNK